MRGKAAKSEVTGDLLFENRSLVDFQKVNEGKGGQIGGPRWFYYTQTLKRKFIISSNWDSWLLQFVLLCLICSGLSHGKLTGYCVPLYFLIFPRAGACRDWCWRMHMSFSYSSVKLLYMYDVTTRWTSESRKMSDSANAHVDRWIREFTCFDSEKETELLENWAFRR